MNEISKIEQPLLFDSGDEQLCGIIHYGEPDCCQGVLILVGGPQYRVGSHRSFVLLARNLAQSGIPVMRFDYSGMGDSSGEFPGFTHVEIDLAAAINTFFEQCPSLERVVLWGLCDGASSAALYCTQDPRIDGLVLVNPWVHSEESEAKTQLNDYYKRFFGKAFWSKLLRFKVDIRGALSGVIGSMRSLLMAKGADSDELSFIDQMLVALSGFKGDVLLILCEQDMTAQEFILLTEGVSEWKKWVSSSAVQQQRMSEADHTFSSHIWRQQLNQLTREWLLKR